MLLLGGDGAKERPNIIWSVVTAEQKGLELWSWEAEEHERASGDFDSGERTWSFSPGLLLILDVLRNKPGGSVE